MFEECMYLHVVVFIILVKCHGRVSWSRKLGFRHWYLRVYSLGALNLNRLKWLGHVLRMPTACRARCTLFSEVGTGWKMNWGSQSWCGKKVWKPQPNRFSRDGQIRLLGRGPRDALTDVWSLDDLVQCYCHWHSCIRNLSSFLRLSNLKLWGWLFHCFSFSFK